jgi:hypothetical protein
MQLIISIEYGVWETKIACSKCCGCLHFETNWISTVSTHIFNIYYSADDATDADNGGGLEDVGPGPSTSQSRSYHEFPALNAQDPRNVYRPHHPQQQVPETKKPKAPGATKKQSVRRMQEVDFLGKESNKGKRMNLI